jgi:hypothetical protein
MPITAHSRPAGTTVLATFLGFEAIAALLNVFVWKSLGDLSGGQLPGDILAFVEAARQPLFTTLALACSATALVAAVGVWLMRSWMVAAFAIWGAVVFVFLLWMWRYFPIDHLPVWGGHAFFAMMVVATLVLLWFCWRYLRRIAASRLV